MKLSVAFVLLTRFIQITRQGSLQIEVEAQVGWRQTPTEDIIQGFSNTWAHFTKILEELEKLKAWFEDADKTDENGLIKHVTSIFQEFAKPNPAWKSRESSDAINYLSTILTSINQTKEQNGDVKKAIESIFETIPTWLQSLRFDSRELVMENLTITVNPLGNQKPENKIVLNFRYKEAIYTNYCDFFVSAREGFPNLQIFNDAVEAYVPRQDGKPESPKTLQWVSLYGVSDRLYSPDRKMVSFPEIKTERKIPKSWMESEFIASQNIELKDIPESNIAYWITPYHTIQSCRIIANKSGNVSLMLEIKFPEILV